MYATTPNETDYISFLYNVVGIPASALPVVIVDPTVAPVLSETAGGTLPATTYYVKYTYANAGGETLPSPEASLAVGANNLLVVASPAAVQGAVTWNVYASDATGTETLQASGIAIGTAWTLPTGGLVAGASPPTANSTANASIITTTLTIATDMVNDTLALAVPDIYVLAVYNYAADRLFNFAPDVTGSTYFATQRTAWNLLVPTTGMVSSAGDEGTSTSILNIEAMKMFTMQDLQMFKTPYGRQYMAFAQTYGPVIWGTT